MFFPCQELPLPRLSRRAGFTLSISSAQRYLFFFFCLLLFFPRRDVLNETHFLVHRPHFVPWCSGSDAATNHHGCSTKYFIPFRKTQNVAISLLTELERRSFQWLATCSPSPTSFPSSLLFLFILYSLWISLTLGVSLPLDSH